MEFDEHYLDQENAYHQGYADGYEDGFRDGQLDVEKAIP